MKSELVCSSNGGKIEELFASILNEIPISVRCVSSQIVILILNAKLTRLVVARSNKKDSEERKSLTRVPFFAS